MASCGTDHIPEHDAVEGSEATIEIKIKTLDSQTYTLRVDKQMPVPALKEQIASVTGVLSEQQRLICRGKVLKDDQLLSAYHVEDGHTLHMVVRQAIPPSVEGLPSHSVTDPASTTSRGVGHSHQVAPGVVIETFSLPVQGEGAPPEISRIVSAVLGSMGISSFGSGNEGIDNREHGSQRPQRTSGSSSLLDSTVHLQSERIGVRAPSDRPNGAGGHSSAFSLGPLSPHVIPDSLTTLAQYLSNMRREFDAIGRDGGNSGRAGASQGSEERSSQFAAGTRQGFPTPASLAEVVLSARQLLTEQAAETLLQLARQLENQVNVTDSSTRTSIQASALRTGALFHNLGSFLLELGRTIMTLRLGQTPSEAVVNAGPAVFISPTGPNPIMVQPLPFQVGSSFGSVPMGSVHAASGLLNGLGTGFLPRRIDIQIRRGSPTATANVNNEEHGNTQQPSAQRNSATSSGSENPANQGTQRASDGAFAGDSGVRVLPLRTMVATMPSSFGRLSSDSSGNSVGLYYPVLGRFQHVASGHASAERGMQASSEQNSAHQPSDSTAQQRPSGDPARDGSLPTPNIRQHEPVNARSVSINILSAGGMQNPESDRQIPSSVMQFIRSLFPGGEIHVEDGSSEGTAAGSHPDQARTSGSAEGGSEAEPRASEGIFFSNLLHQLMPLISRQAGSESDIAPAEQANASEAENSNVGTSHQGESSSAGTSRRQGDCESGSPSSKRRKVE
ncbi:large proline-rich protein bag6-A [Morus notabilis]|uniref:large proline-rich protein bag6-A n=1 Tax=Morus notabilis TaxID=981085 RepID=UPI000CED6560|nr:large proline-rich protein bag6-A [Morus notabilis]XP_024028600.1 large proline-rich protein bag6-A [Morus notabilis]XP_024028601.1 large proline-rich protein bag6-A [Morus notabilis]